MDTSNHFFSIECKVADGESGVWKVRTVIEKNETNLNYFKYLYKEESIIMTSTPFDVKDLEELWKRACGSVLLTGLGLGCAITVVIDKPEVKDITVLEKEIDVIRIVAPAYNHSKIKIIHADAFEWEAPPGKIYDCVWHDVFNHKYEINQKDVERLFGKYEKIAKWQGMKC